MKLQEYLKKFSRLAVALSGDMNSALLLREAAAALGPERVLAITAKTELIAETQLEMIRKIAQFADVSHVVVPVSLLEDDMVRQNGPLRCYYCKRHIFRAIRQEAWLRGYPTVAEGSYMANHEDSNGLILELFADLQIISPFIACQMDLRDICSLRLDESLDAKSSSHSCLAREIPCGTPITEEALEQLEYKKG